MKIKAVQTNEIWIEFSFSSLDGDDMSEDAVYATIDAETQALEEAGYRLDYDSELWSKENGDESLFVEHSWLKIEELDDKGD